MSLQIGETFGMEEIIVFLRSNLIIEMILPTRSRQPTRHNFDKRSRAGVSASIGGQLANENIINRYINISYT